MKALTAMANEETTLSFDVEALKDDLEEKEVDPQILSDLQDAYEFMDKTAEDLQKTDIDACWNDGDTALASTWGKFVMDLIEEHEQSALYWFLISKGFRTYRYLPLFFREFYPRSDHPTAEEPLRIVTALGRPVARQERLRQPGQQAVPAGGDGLWRGLLRLRQRRLARHLSGQREQPRP